MQIAIIFHCGKFPGAIFTRRKMRSKETGMKKHRCAGNIPPAQDEEN